MRRRDFIMLAGGALSSLAGAGAAPAQSLPGVSASREFGPWGFDFSGADFATKPGDDFFRYGNGAWFDRTIIAPDRDISGVDIALKDKAEASIRDILERGSQDVEPAARNDAAKIGWFYANFMDETRAEALGATPITGFLQRIRAANSHAAVARLMGAANQAFFACVFDVSIDVDAKAPNRYAVLINQGGLGMPNRDYYLTAQFAEKKAAYRDYVSRVLDLVGWQAAAASAMAVVDFESAIAEVSWTMAERRDSEKTYNPLTIAALEQAAPLNWRDLLQAAELGAVDRVVLSEVTAIPKIAALFARTPVEILQAWQAFHVADEAAPNLSKRFVAANFEFRGTTLSGVAELAPRWKRAVRTVETAMGHAVGRIYVAHHFSAKAKAQTAALIAQLQRAFKARIEQVAWMTPDTKSRALEKLARLGTKIGYPDQWRDYSKLDIRQSDLIDNVLSGKKFEWLRKVDRLNAPVDRGEWDMTPQTVDAYYNSNLNDITFPAAILQAPFFDPAADAAVNYGGIGTLIGHELTHGFDDDGRKYDAGGLLSDWWTEKDAQEFTARAALLGRQYDSYEPFPGTHIQGDLTMGENIADLGGFLIALDAYRRLYAGRTPPVLDGLTGDQRFFLSFAQSWRNKRTEDGLRKRLVSDPHAPEQYRVNGVVRNVDAWYQAFDVKPGDKLYLAAAERVRIW